MPAPNPTIGNRPNDLKTSDLLCNPGWKNDSGGRHLIFLFDGTWEDETGVNPAEFNWDDARQLWVSLNDPSQAFPPILSNVAKTHFALAPDNARQVTHYYRGIGNEEENDFLNRATEGVFSTMEEHIRNAAYCNFLETYCQGDRISILGFSRGAASARLFAHDLRTRGLVSEVRIGSRFSQQHLTGEVRRDVWDLTTRWSTTLVPGESVPISFLGVWDTVATNVSAPATAWDMPDNVARAVHCTAIDESRDLFKPTLLRYAQNRRSDMKEVWFPGGHGDVGGGYFNDALARVTLDFMWKNWASALAAQQLTGLDWRTELAASYVATENLPWLRHQELGLAAKLGGVSPRDLTPCTGDLPRIHPSVERFLQEGGLQFCTQGEGFPPACTISSPVYQPLAYPNRDKVEFYNSTTWD